MSFKEMETKMNRMEGLTLDVLKMVGNGYIAYFKRWDTAADDVVVQRPNRYPKAVRNMFKVHEDCAEIGVWDLAQWDTMVRAKDHLPLAKTLLAMNKYDRYNNLGESMSIEDALEAYGCPTLVGNFVKELEKFVAASGSAPLPARA
jgi:hypothetical protein